MPRTKRPENVKPVRCGMCRKEIPSSEAVVPEAQDRLMHYCSLDCYDRWKKNAEKENRR